MIRMFVVSYIDTQVACKKISLARVKSNGEHSQCHSNVVVNAVATLHVSRTLTDFESSLLNEVLSKNASFREASQLKRRRDGRPTPDVTRRTISVRREARWNSHGMPRELREDEGGKRASLSSSSSSLSPVFFFSIFTERVPRLGASRQV